MSYIIFLSVGLRVFAFGTALLMWWRGRDWRLAFLALMLGLMAMHQLMSTGQVLGQEFRFSEIFFQTTHGETLGVLVSILAVAAVFYLKQWLRERMQIRASLEYQKIYLTNVLNHTADAIIVIDDAGCITTFNRSAELLFGYTSEEISGQNVKVLTPEPIRGQHDGYLRDYMRTGAGKILGIGPRELTAVRKDGMEIPIELSVGEMRFGEDRSFIGVIRDISRRKDRETLLVHAQKMEGVGRLTGGIAHDFNNFLQVIIGNLEFIGEQNDVNSLTMEFQENALRACLRGAELTHHLLAFSRKQTLEPKSSDINDLVSCSTTFIRHTIGVHIEIETVLAGGLWPAMIDPVQLESALLNLAINARDAMPHGGKITIETSNARLDPVYSKEHLEVTAGQYVLVAISDTGIGMTPETIKQAFDPFFTTKEVGKGSGLGLSMIYGFVKQSGGHTEIYSKVGEGTTVKLYLPKDQGLGLAAPAQKVRDALPTGDETILVVEDDPDVCTFVTGLLRALGYNVLVAYDGPAAIRLMDETPVIDLLFTDVVLPNGMSGHGVALEFGKRFPDTPVLYTSGYTDSAIVHDGRLNEGVQLIAKPYRRVSLAQRIRAALDGHERF